MRPSHIIQIITSLPPCDARAPDATHVLCLGPDSITLADDSSPVLHYPLTRHRAPFAISRPHPRVPYQHQTWPCDPFLKSKSRDESGSALHFHRAFLLRYVRYVTQEISFAGDITQYKKCLDCLTIDNFDDINCSEHT